MNLFTPDAPWVNASKHVDVFELYGGWVARGSYPSQIRQIVSDLNRRGILIAFEASALSLTDDCQNGISAWTEEGLQISHDIRDAGGVVSFVAMDAPFARANMDSQCHWSAEKIAPAVMDYVNALRSVFPNVVVGDTEPLLSHGVVAAYENWLTTYQAVTGERMPFFHLDTEWTIPSWPQWALELETFVRQNGIKFGMLYEDNYDNWYNYPNIDTSYTDQVWFSRAESHMITYEAEFGGRPDQVLFQSWVDKPDYVLPETAPYSFTHLIFVYFRERTTLGISLSQERPDGTRLLGGVLATSDGRDLYGMGVTITARLEKGPPIFAEYEVSGIVPATATKADLGFRVNQECGCVGTSDFDIYWVKYTEGTDQVNRVPNWDFSDGLNGWGYWGNGSVNLEPSDMGGGSMLHAAATSNQTIGMNSGDFAVTPGANFTVVFGAKIAPESVGSGYLSAVFMGQTESMRKTIVFEPPLLTLGIRTTDVSGAFSMALRGLGPGTFFIQLEFAGDDSYWPAFAEVTVRN